MHKIRCHVFRLITYINHVKSRKSRKSCLFPETLRRTLGIRKFSLDHVKGLLILKGDSVMHLPFTFKEASPDSKLVNVNIQRCPEFKNSQKDKLPPEGRQQYWTTNRQEGKLGHNDPYLNPEVRTSLLLKKKKRKKQEKKVKNIKKKKKSQK